MLAAFAYFDTDDSGYITVEKVEEACREYNIQDVAGGAPAGCLCLLRQGRQRVHHRREGGRGLPRVQHTSCINTSSGRSTMTTCHGRIDDGEFVAMVEKGIIGNKRLTRGTAPTLSFSMERTASVSIMAPPPIITVVPIAYHILQV